MNPIEKLWQEYKDKVLPANAPPVQISECRNAFFAGAAALFQTVTNNLSEGPDPEESDLAMMDEIFKELESYPKRIAGSKN